MKVKIFSFRGQILFIVLILLLSGILLTRNFFIVRLNDYRDEVKDLQLEDKIWDLYKNNKDVIEKKDIAKLLSNIQEIYISGEIFQKEIGLYSIIFTSLVILITFFVFLIFFNLMTRPLRRLQKATKKVTTGDLDIQVKESNVPQVNELIVSFNSMVNELRANRDKLIQAEKDMMWREMAQVMAHEIKNPLTPIRLTVERLEQKFYHKKDDFNKIFDGSLEIIYEEIGNLERLVKQFSHFAKMPSTNFIKYDLNQQIIELVEPYKEQAKIILTLDNNLPKFYGDKFQIRQVIVNLLQNALQSIQENGKIEIITRCYNSKILLSIQDNGKGIPKENMNKIFKPYFSDKEKGTGLGLAIVKRIVQQHNGTIEVESKIGKGTKFTVKFTVVC